MGSGCNPELVAQGLGCGPVLTSLSEARDWVLPLAPGCYPDLAQGLRLGRGQDLGSGCYSGCYPDLAQGLRLERGPWP